MSGYIIVDGCFCMVNGGKPLETYFPFSEEAIQHPVQTEQKDEEDPFREISPKVQLRKNNYREEIGRQIKKQKSAEAKNMSREEARRFGRKLVIALKTGEIPIPEMRRRSIYLS